MHRIEQASEARVADWNLGRWKALDTIIDGTFPIAELDLALLQMSEGTQGARTLTLHHPFLGNFSHHLALSETSV